MIKLKAPEGHTSVSFGGNQFQVAEDGTIDVPAEAVQALRGFGFVDVPAVASDAGETLLDQVLSDAHSAVDADPAPAADPAPEPEPAPAPATDPAPAPAPVPTGKAKK